MIESPTGTTGTTGNAGNTGNTGTTAPCFAGTFFHTNIFLSCCSGNRSSVWILCPAALTHNLCASQLNPIFLLFFSTPSRPPAFLALRLESGQRDRARNSAGAKEEVGRSVGSKVRGDRKLEEVCGGLLCLERGDLWRGVGRKSSVVRRS